MNQVSEDNIVILLFRIHFPLDAFNCDQATSDVHMKLLTSKNVAKPTRISCRFRVNDKISVIKTFLNSLDNCPERYILRISFPLKVISDLMHDMTLEQAGVSANMIFDVIPIIE